MASGLFVHSSMFYYSSNLSPGRTGHPWVNVSLCPPSKLTTVISCVATFLCFPGRYKVCKYMWLAQVWSEPTHTNLCCCIMELHGPYITPVSWTLIFDAPLKLPVYCPWHVDIRVNYKLLFTGWNLEVSL